MKARSKPVPDSIYLAALIALLCLFAYCVSFGQ